MKNIEELLQDGGSDSIEPKDDIPCVACAADIHNTIALLIRRNGESLAYPVPVHLRGLEQGAAALLARPSPPHPGTVHLVICRAGPHSWQHEVFDLPRELVGQHLELLR